MKKTLIALMLAACALPAPYVTERNVWDLSRHWASRGGSATKVLTVHNPLPVHASVDVWCYGSPFEGRSERTFELDAGKDAYVLIDVPARYQVGEACTVVR